MPDDNIEISFDDNDNKESKRDPETDPEISEERIIIDFDAKEETEAKVEEEITAPTPEDVIRTSEIDSSYKANSQLNNFFPSAIKFPEGIESGFREGAKTDLKDSFLNSMLENNRFIITASVSGMIYFVDRFTKKLHRKVGIDNNSFEKTGLVHKNVIYVNSISGIYRIDDAAIESGMVNDPVYRSEPGFYIWSSLNRAGDIILFLEYSPERKAGNLVLFDTVTSQKVFSESFNVESSINQLLCVIGEKAYFLADGQLFICDIGGKKITRKKVDFEADESSFLIGNGNKLYLTSNDGKIYFLDNASDAFKFTGIVEHNINSIAGFDGNLFVGAHDGWKYYNANGVLVYSHEDVVENKVEALSKNMLVVSKRNKIVFHNLIRFQEAEGFIIKTEDDAAAQDIFSSIISFNEVYALTKQGILTFFTNDKLNIHV
jgi:hypothetical protein